MRELATIFKALSDETRLGIMALLIEYGELCVCDIEEALETSQSKTSRHLRTLLHAGLVQDRREGVWVHYSIPKGMDDVRGIVRRMLKKTLVGDRVAAIHTRFKQTCCVDGKCLPASTRAQMEAK